MTRSERKIAGQCEACKTDLYEAGEESYQLASYLLLPLAPGVTALCCAKASRAPKGSCARLIRQRRNLCPGCGEGRGARWNGRAMKGGGSADMEWQGVLCDECTSSIARQRAAGEQNVELYRLLSMRIFPYIGESDLAIDAARHLARAVVGPRRRWVDEADSERFGKVPFASNTVPNSEGHLSGRNTDPVVEMTEEQAVSLDAFVKVVRAALVEQRAEGFKEGDDLLRRFAKGDVKPADYEQWGVRKDGR